MKTMTCKQMGGPCDTAFQGEDSKTIMDLGAAHINEMAAQGDPAHIAVKKMMDDAMADPAAAKAWADKFEADFAALPND